MESVVESPRRRSPFRSPARLSARALTNRVFTAVGLLVLLNFPSVALAQDLQALMDRIDRLERDIRTLNTQLARGEAPLVSSDSSSATDSALGGSGMTGSAIARFDARMTSLEEDVRATTGTMESLDYRIRTIESQLEKIVSDIEFRLSSIEQGRGLVPSQNTGQSLTAAPTVAPVTKDVGQTKSTVLGTITETQLQNITSAEQPAANGDALQSSAPNAGVAAKSGSTEPAGETSATASDQQAALSPKEQYTNAFGLLRQAKYDEAATALQAFIEQHPDDPLAPNARYWLGETYYVRSEFVRAAEVFFEGYRLDPTAQKAPDTLLKLGMALGNLGKKTEACAAFNKLADEFPNASANVRSTLERERLRNGC